MKLSVRKSVLPFAILLIAACNNAIPADPEALPASASPVYISEYKCGDLWLEICNPTDSSVALNGYTLIVNSRKQPFDKSALGPGEFRLIREIQALSEAESIFITDADGSLVDLIGMPVMKKHKSVVRTPGEDGEMRSHNEENITPGFPNDRAGYKAYQATRRRPNATGIVFSEISASGDPDYIELHNTSAESVNLSGFGLSDKENYAAFSFPEGTVIAPDGYLAVYCSKEPSDTTRLWAGFSLRNGEDFVYLSDPEDHILLEYGPVSMPKGQSLASIQGYPFITTEIMTPGKPNEATGIAPAASVASGQYDGIDTLEVRLVADGEIHYTLNGALPGKGSEKYTKPFRLAKTTVIRAVAVSADGTLSPVSSYTFLINEGHQLDVVSLVSNPDGLFSTGSGIYSNGPYRLKPNGTEDDGTPGINYPYTEANYWRKWWRKANVSFLPKEGAGFSVDCGTSIFGGFSRINAKKSMKFKFKSVYGPSKLHYKLFPEREMSEYKSFIVRTGGQDVYGTLIKDDLASSLAEGLLDLMATRPVVYYINGQYYGIYFLREKVNKHFIAGHYNIPTDSLDIIQGYSNTENGTIREWNAFLSYVKSHDLSKPECYKWVTDRMDIQSFTDWVIAETYIDNRDAGNVRCFKTPYLDNKWHWILYDVDMGLYSPRSDTFLVYYRPTAQRICQTDLIRALLKNPEYREFYLSRLEYQMTSVWNKDRVNAAIDRYVEMLDSEVARNNKRWQGSYDGWKGKIEGLHRFADGRQAYLKEQFASHSLLQSLVHMTAEELDRCFPDAK